MRTQDNRLSINQVVTYTQATPIAPGAPAQPIEDGPYIAKIVDHGDLFALVRADGFMGTAPLYVLLRSDILKP